MAKIYHEHDAHLQHLNHLSVGVIGYGNQGRAHAFNLRDSGVSVRVGTRLEGKTRQQAVSDGFDPETFEEVAANCEVIALLLPDEVIPQIYEESVEPYLEAHDTFVFAHGFTVANKTIRLPDDADVVLVAPTGPGRQLRSLYMSGHGLPALVAVGQDSSGLAWKRCLAYAGAIGCLRAGAVETTFYEETITDLFCEQAVLCGGIPELIKASFQTLLEAGYQPELAYISCLKEVKLIADLLFERGLDGMRGAISNTARYGSARAGPRIINSSTEHRLRQILNEIETGRFAEMFLRDTEEGAPAAQDFTLAERHSKIARTGRALTEVLKF